MIGSLSTSVLAPVGAGAKLCSIHCPDLFSNSLPEGSWLDHRDPAVAPGIVFEIVGDENVTGLLDCRREMNHVLASSCFTS